MKKKLLLIFIVILMITFISCGKSGWNNHEQISIPRKLRFECFYSKHFGTNTTATATAIDDATEAQQKISFYSPIRKSIDRLKNHPNWYPNNPEIDNNSPRYCYRIKILDIELYSKTRSVMNPWKWPQTCYHVQIICNESTGEEINHDAYILDADGSPQFVQYGYSRLSIGQEYLIVDAYDAFLINWREFQNDYVYIPPYIFEIQTIDNVEYIYPCKCDISSLDFKIEITDPIENQIYKDYKDWDIIKYIQSNTIENPTFNYKLKLDEFIEYRNTYNLEWNNQFVTEISLEDMKEYALQESIFIPDEDRIYVNKRIFD